MKCGRDVALWFNVQVLVLSTLRRQPLPLAGELREAMSPPPGWLSVIWRFIKVRGPRHACVRCGFFYFMESLISRGSLASAHIPVFDECSWWLKHTMCFLLLLVLNASHDKQEGSRHITQMCSRGCLSLHYMERGSLQREWHMRPWRSFSPWLSEGNGVKHNVRGWKMKRGFNNHYASVRTVFYIAGSGI